MAHRTILSPKKETVLLEMLFPICRSIIERPIERPGWSREGPGRRGRGPDMALY